MERPSTITSSLLAYWPLKPRMETFATPRFISITSTPGTERSRSMMVTAPLARMSSSVMTVTAAGTSLAFCAFLDAVVTVCSPPAISSSALAELLRPWPSACAATLLQSAREDSAVNQALRRTNNEGISLSTHEALPEDASSEYKHDHSAGTLYIKPCPFFRRSIRGR